MHNARIVYTVARLSRVRRALSIITIRVSELYSVHVKTDVRIMPYDLWMNVSECSNQLHPGW